MTDQDKKIFDREYIRLELALKSAKQCQKSNEKIIVMIDEMLDNGLVVNTDPDSLDKLISHQEEAGSKFISFGTSETTSSSGGGLFSSIFSGAKSIFG